MVATILAACTVFGIGTVASAQHYVAPGESLSKIAKEYNMTLQDLISLNPHISNPNVIHPNDYIIIRSKTETQKDLVDYARSLQSVTAYVYGAARLQKVRSFPSEGEPGSSKDRNSSKIPRLTNR
jgi:LysM repeat protein